MSRRKTAFASILAVLAAPAFGQPQAAERIEIDMASYKFMPATITLHRGRAYVLHFVNRSGGTHNFAGKLFFAAAQVAPADRAVLGDGKVELRGGESADVHLVAPGPGRYGAKCSRFLHSAFGMKAEIVVI